MQKFRADAVVEADAAGNFLDVRTDLFAQIRDFVDEGDLRREERVGRVFDQLRCTPAGVHDRRRIEIKRPIKLGHDLASRARPRFRSRCGPDA